MEQITSAAIKVKEEVYTGECHADIYREHRIEGLRIEGFVTSTGRFVDREEGMRIAKSAKQIRELGAIDEVYLHSCDLVS